MNHRKSFLRQNASILELIKASNAVDIMYRCQFFFVCYFVLCHVSNNFSKIDLAP